MDDIKVTVVEFGNRRCYQLQYRDPMTRRKKTKTTDVVREGTKKARTAAERAAAKWEAELREGRYQDPSRIAWDTFRDRYESEYLASLSAGTYIKVTGIFNVVEKILNPAKLMNLTAERLSHYQAKLRERGASENTIRGHLAHIKGALNWAKGQSLLVSVPTINMPKRAKGAKMMKGRPITGEEFDRMLAAVPKVVVDHPKDGDKPSAEREAYLVEVVASWKHYLEGLWLSGLRLVESLDLYWDRADKLCIDLDGGKYPRMRIPAALEKGNRDRLLPLTPEFAAFLQRTPEDERTGRVFKPLASRIRGPRLLPRSVGKLVTLIGKKAGVKVNTDAKGKVKYASAHDLRRSFGQRLAGQLKPQQLMAMMRHENIETTMKFYVGDTADATGDALWAHEPQEMAGNTSGNTAAK